MALLIDSAPSEHLGEVLPAG